MYDPTVPKSHVPSADTVCVAGRQQSVPGVDGVTWDEYEHGLEERRCHQALDALSFASERRRERGDSEPETFDFLGFTHRCGITKTKGWFTVERTTIAQRMRQTLARVKLQLIQMRHVPLGDVGRWLGRVVRGWMNYFAVPGNMRRLRQFVDEVS